MTPLQDHSHNTPSSILRNESPGISRHRRSEVYNRLSPQKIRDMAKDRYYLYTKMAIFRSDNPVQYYAGAGKLVMLQDHEAFQKFQS